MFDIFFDQITKIHLKILFHIWRHATHPDFSVQIKNYPDFPIPRVKIPDFCFVSQLDKQKGVSLCRMASVFKPSKWGLKINFIINLIDGLGLILWTPRLSEWSRLASLSRHPEVTWCYSSADPRNSAALKDHPIFPWFYPFSSVCNDLGCGMGKVRSSKL